MLKNEHAQKYGRREANKAKKLAAIEAAGRRLFAELGYGATTTRAIAGEAGIGVGTLFVYFPEKLDLLVHLYHHDLVEVTTAAFEAADPAQTLVDQSLAIFGAIFRLYERDEALARVFVKELLFLSPDRQAAMFAMTLVFFDRLGVLVEGAQAAGHVEASLAPRAVAYQLFGTYWFALVSWLSTDFVSRDARDQQLRAQLELLMVGLARRPGARSEETGR